MELILYYLLIIISMVYITDHSGIILDLSKWVWEKRNGKGTWKYQILGKPWSCSMCQSFWIGLVVGIIGWNVVWGLFIGTVGAIISLIIKNLMRRLLIWINKI